MSIKVLEMCLFKVLMSHIPTFIAWFLFRKVFLPFWWRSFWPGRELRSNKFYLYFQVKLPVFPETIWYIFIQSDVKEVGKYGAPLMVGKVNYFTSIRSKLQRALGELIIGWAPIIIRCSAWVNPRSIARLDFYQEYSWWYWFSGSHIRRRRQELQANFFTWQ